MSELSSEIRNHPQYAYVHEQRERDAAIARQAQKRYRQYTRVLIISTALASLIGAIILYGLEAQPDSSRWFVDMLAKSIAQNILTGIQAICLAGAVAAGYLLGEYNPAERWIEHRIRAENGRLKLAKRALEIGHELGATQFVEAGDYFLSFVASQRKHHYESATKHQSSWRALVTLGALLTAALALATGLAGLQVKAIAIFFAIVGVCSPAFVAALRSWRQATQSKKRTKLHERTCQTLNKIGEDEAAFKNALDSHDLEKALGYAEQVFFVLHKDHKEFSALYEKRD